MPETRDTMMASMQRLSVEPHVRFPTVQQVHELDFDFAGHTATSPSHPSDNEEARQMAAKPVNNMSNCDAKVIGWTKERALLGMKPRIVERWEAVNSPKCILYYAFPYRRSDGGQGLGPKLKLLLGSILSRSDVMFVTAADRQSSMSDSDVRLIATLVCDLTEAERDKLLSQPSWSSKDLTVFVHPWYPSPQSEFVGLLRGSESPNDTKVLTRDLTDAIGYMRMPGNRHAVDSIDVRPCIDTRYRAVYVSYSSSHHDRREEDMATLRTMTFDTVVGTQKIFSPQPCDLCLGVDHTLTHCPFKPRISYNLPLDDLSKSSKRRHSAGEDGPDSKRVKVAESSDTEL
ncbi:hypothetical protein BDZ89DRAFT_564658 [Hymenopellis radicata]|nr:hypothetical protein BDZ89DRAFT_564658 [Hymenopellis radicata]